MRKTGTLLPAISIVGLLLSGCGVDGNRGTNSVDDGTDELVSAQVIDDINASVMLNYVHGLDPNATNAFGYKAVKISYNTINQDGQKIKASGLLTIPVPTKAYINYLASIGKPFSVSMICENHGTIFTNAEAPSNVEVSDGVPNYPTAIGMTGYAGFASINPDYIGFGDSKGVVQPYMLEKASAQSALDMIKASMKYMESHGIVLNHQLYVSGYSQGGYNAMAVAKSIEEGNLPNVNLMATAAMAGPYNLEDLANVELNATHIMQYPAFLADLANSYTYYYNDLNLSDVIVESNTTKFRGLFNGDYNAILIHIGLGLANGTTDLGFKTHQADELFKTSFIDDYQNNLNNAFRVRLQENNLDSWSPKTKVNLIQCVDDEIIPFSEAQNTYAKMKASGADVTLSPIPTNYLQQQVDLLHPFVHANCAPTAYGVAVKWFDDIRQGRI